jgi:hypothetical protein
MQDVCILPLWKERQALGYYLLGYFQNHYILQKMVKEKQTVIAKIFSILLVLADKSFIGDEILLTSQFTSFVS